jgi:hypothetical protein
VLVASAPAMDGLLGAVFAYSRGPGGWVEEAKLSPPGPSVGMGEAVCLDGDILVAGADDTDFGGQNNPGLAYVFQRFQAGWAPIEQLESWVSQPETFFGSSVSVSGTRVAIGAPGKNPQTTPLNQGKADALEITPVDAFVYCTAKVNSQGCVPAIGWSGTPSASAGSGFDVYCLENRDNVSGTFFYGVSGPKFAPYQGGYLCVQGPAKRTGIQNSGGSGACTGEFHYDFNARIASGADPQLFAGQTVWGQYWSRDSQSSFGSNRSDAIEFTIQP